MSTSSPPLIVYGANGFTGRRIVAEMLRRGLRPLLAGRDGHALAALAEAAGLRYAVARLDVPKELQALLAGGTVVLNAAGPFSATVVPLLEASLRCHVHYLDVSGEIEAIELAAARTRVARASGLMIMCGVGFDVFPSDSLAVFAASRLGVPSKLRFGIAGLGWFSAGSAATMAGYAGQPVTVRRSGRLLGVAPGSLEHDFDFGGGPARALAVNWGDVATAYYSTGAPNIEVFFQSTPALEGAVQASRLGAALKAGALWAAASKALAATLPARSSRPDGSPVTIVVEAHGPGGRRMVTRMRTPEVYSFTASAAAAICARTLDGDLEPGFQTPGRLYGSDYVLSFPGVAREELCS